MKPRRKMNAANMHIENLFTHSAEWSETKANKNAEHDSVRATQQRKDLNFQMEIPSYFGDGLVFTDYR